MNRDEALGALTSAVPSERLGAARYLQFWAVAADVPTLRLAIQREPVAWVRRALEASLLRLGDENTRTVDLEQLRQGDSEQTADAAALARARVARNVVHELEPIVGAIEYYASQEIANYEGSLTRDHVDRLARMLRAIETLGKISASPRTALVDIPRLLSRLVEAQRIIFDEPIGLEGPSALVASADPDLLSMIIGNALKNACEAALEVDVHPSEVTVIYGLSDRELWIAVIDNGIGLPVGGADRLFELGTSTKEEHLGVGLTLAAEAVTAMGGSIKLSSDGMATRFELSVPLAKAGE